MRNMLKVLKSSFSRNRFMLILVALAAVLMCNVYHAGKATGNTYNVNKIPIGVVDYDKSALSADILLYLSDTIGMEVHMGNGYDEMSDLLINRDISAIIEIPDGFYQDAAKGNLQNLILTTLDDYENAAFVQAYLDSYMRGISVLSASANDEHSFIQMLQADVQRTAVTAEDAVPVNQSTLESAGFRFASGFFLMIIMGLSLIVTITVLDDRQLGTYSRIQLSPVKPLQYIAGVTAFGIIVCSLVGAALLSYLYVIRADIGIPYWLAAFLFFVFILFSTGVSIVIGLSVNAKNTAFTIICGYTTISCILGGAWFPVTESLGYIKNFSLLTPHYWFMQILWEYPENPAYQYIPNIIILVLFTVLAYFVAAVVFTKKSR